MADVESIQPQEGRVALGLIMTPRPSPDEAMRIAGEGKQVQNRDKIVGTATRRSDDEGLLVADVSETAEHDTTPSANKALTGNNTGLVATSPSASPPSNANNRAGVRTATPVDEDGDMTMVDTQDEQVSIQQDLTLVDGQNGLDLLANANAVQQLGAQQIPPYLFSHYRTGF
ncbi:hypothetical protein ABW19_dt0210648 [Dactylella cylindrospora]|nr:hypothetical protein ABW19_dt0210648 [Dactylella cylindrospora]